MSDERQAAVEVAGAIYTSPSDRSGWPAGPWDAEPDRIDFSHAGLPCLMHRNRLGAWCGYVAVPVGHPWHGKHYDAIDVHVHGGLTYAARPRDVVRVLPFDGDDWSRCWIVGFDCSHAGDAVPGMLTMTTFTTFRRMPGDSAFFDEPYRDVQYVRREVEVLAEKAREVSA